MNKAAFDGLDKATQEAIAQGREAAEERGWKVWQEKTDWYLDQLAAKGMKVLPPSPALKTGFQKIGEQLTADWLEEGRRRRPGGRRRLQEDVRAAPSPRLRTSSGER